MEFRPSALAREWARTGHETRIVAGAPSHVRAHDPELRRRVTLERVDGVDFEWYRLPSYDGNGARRAANIVTFAALLRARSGALAREFAPDIVVASSTHPLDIYGARSIARRSGARLVFEVHDLWPLTPIELGGVSPRNPFIAAMDRAERYACRHADLVVSILPSADDYLVTRGLDRARYVHIPNGISLDELEGDAEPLPAAHTELIASLRAAGTFIVGYAGGIGMANALDDLVSALAFVPVGRVAGLVWGDGPDRAALEERIRREGISGVHLLGRIPKPAVGSALAACDAAFLGWKRLGIYRYGVSPNKLWDYMAAGLPIVHATSAPGDPVAACGCGVSVPSEDPRALADALLDIASRPAGELAEMGRRGRASVERNNDYAVLAARFLTAVEQSGR
jgi:glycosyltransferase involved in cell wall biosynthesis